MSKTTRILIVEDNPSDYELARREIQKSLDSCRFKRVETQQEYVDELQSFQPEVILSDYSLPLFDGMTALKLARERLPLVPFILWTGSTSEDVAVECMVAGAANYVLKDDLKRLGPAILRAIEERNLVLENKRTEELIRDLSRFPEENPNPILRVTRDGSILYANSASQVLFQQWNADGSDELPAAWKRVVSTSFEQNLKQSMDVVVHDHFYSIMVIPVCEAGYVNLYGSDITERRRAEGKYQSIFEDSPVGIFQSTSDGRFINVNSAMARIYGYDSPEDMINSVSDISSQLYLTIQDRDALTQLLAATGTVREYEMQNIRKDGSAFWTSTSARVVRDPDGRMLYYEGFLQDITERKRAQAQIDDLLLLNEKILSHSPLGILTYKLTGECIFANEKAAEIVGTTVEGLKAQNFHRIEAWKASGLYALVQSAISSGTLASGDVHHRSSFGKDIWLAIRCVTFQAKEEQHLLLSISDITERKRAEEELRQKNDDLRLMNVVNNAIVRGQDLNSVIDLLAHELKRIFSAVGSTIYMLAADKRSLTMNQYSFSPKIERRIEKLIGFKIPRIEIPIKEGGHFHNALLTKQSTITSDPQKIKEWIAEFVETRSLPAVARTAVRKLIPHIFKLLKIESTIIVPLISQDEVIGFLDVSSSELFTSNDLKRIEAIGEQLTSLIQRQQANEKLRNSEEFLQGIQNSLSAHMAILDENGVVVQVNEAWRDFGDQNGSQDTDYCIGMNYLTICDSATGFDAEPAKEIAAAIRQVLSGERAEASVEYPCHSPTEKRWFTLHITCFNDGKQKWVILAHENITERKLAEEQLQQSENRYRTVVENQTEFIVRWRPDGTRTFVNDAYCRYFEITREQALSTGFLPLIHEDDRQFVEEKISRLLSGASRVETETHRVIRADGSISWNEWTDQALYDQDGQLAEFQAVGRDITERKRAENELRASEERFRQLATNIEEVFWMTEAETGRELYASPAVEKVWGIAADQLLNEPDIHLSRVLPSDRSILQHGIEKEKSGEKVEMEYRIAHPDGSIHWIWDRAFPIFDEDGRVKILAGISTDITERKQNELEIQRHFAELEALYENGLAIGRLLEPWEIGNQIIQTFARYLSWHHVAIRLLDAHTDTLELIALNQPGLNDESRDEIEARFKTMVTKVGQGLSGWAMQTGEAIRTGNVHTHPQYVVIHEDIRSGLYMPLKAGERIIGSISVESDRPDAFTEQDERLLATLANQAAIAFENARLYQAAQQELSERKRAQQALWLSETHYRQLADSITDILFELDHDLRYTHWNKASEMFSGIPAEDAIGHSIRDLFGVSDEQLQREDIYRNVLQERQARIFETTIIARGQKRDLEISAYPSARGVSVVARDVTERKVFEALLQKRFELIEYSNNHSLEDVMQKVVDEVSTLTGSHIGFLHLVEADETTINLQAWSTETLECFSRTESAAMHYPLDQAGVWADAVRQRRPVIHDHYESLAHKKGLPEGHVPLIRELVIPIIRNDKIVAVIGVGNKEHEYTTQDITVAERFADYAWDITERRRIESELAEERNQLARRVEDRTADLSRANANLARALRVKDEFLANMSHELRTPLNAILGLSESLSEQVAGPLNEKQSKYLSTINESGHHLLSLINDILDLAKIEAGQITLDINKVDVNSVCQASLRMIKQLAQKKNQDVSFEIDPDLGLMWADERRLKQMIVNLLSNAVKFTPEQGKLGLEVQGDQEGNKVTISVWDRGIGISENDMDRLFRPFIQLDSGLAREATGTGLGLALVAQMAQMHGGSVSVESQLGHGSRFTIMLPWEPALAGDPNSRLRSTGKFRAIDPNAVKPTILLIEDTQEVVMMLVDYLEMAGFNMVTAQDGIDGLTQAKIAHPDLILMDIQMPRMDGFETTRKLRNDPEFKETPIIALTALAMPNDRQRCLDAGMNEYLSKPINLKVLSKTIKAFLYEQESNQS